MSANTAGGAAGQSTDLMNDFKVGLAIGAHQAAAVDGEEHIERRRGRVC